MEAAHTPLERWHEFYLLIGTSAAALVALLFVAVSVGTGFITPERSHGTRTYISPVAVHFVSVLVVSAIALVPSHTRISLALIIGAGAVGMMVCSVYVLIRVLKGESQEIVDWLGYGVAPLICYAGLLAAAILFFLDVRGGPELLAAAVVLLLIVTIRDAWDLLLFIVRQRRTSAD